MNQTMMILYDCVLRCAPDIVDFYREKYEMLVEAEFTERCTGDYDLESALDELMNYNVKRFVKFILKCFKKRFGMYEKEIELPILYDFEEDLTKYKDYLNEFVQSKEVSLDKILEEVAFNDLTLNERIKNNLCEMIRSRFVVSRRKLRKYL
jgi:hypothetical protein